jgi:Fanconi anemia group M protein
MSLVSITGALSYLAAIQRVTVISTLCLEHTAHMIVKLTRHAVEGLGYELDLRGAGPKDPSEAAVFVLQGIPGISPMVARELLKAFGSIAQIAQADFERLRKVPGVGPKRAEAIFATLRASFTSL